MRGPKGSVGVLLVVVLAAMVGVTNVAAQTGGPPPLPIIYQGEVFLDGEPVADGALSGRVGSWLSDTVPVTDGTFRCADPCLLIGPPTVDYVGQEVTFHLEGVDTPATFRFDFPNLAEPRSDTVQLFFETDPSGGFPLLWLAVGLGGLAIVAGAGYAVRKRAR